MGQCLCMFTSLAFEMRWPSVPTEPVAVLAAFPLAVRQVDITSVTCLDTDDTINATLLASYRSHHLQIFCRDLVWGCKSHHRGTRLAAVLGRQSVHGH